MKEEYPTELLLKRLFKTSSISGFINRYGEHMVSVPLSEYISQLCSAKGTVAERVIIKSGIARTYGHQLFSGTRKPSRDKAIQLAFGFEMTYDETQELLRVARKSLLYPKIERDAAIIFALNKRLTVAETQAMLRDMKLPTLGEDVKDEYITR